MILAIKLLAWLIAPAFNAWVDRKGKKPFYLVVNIFRGVACIVHGSLFIPGWAWQEWFRFYWPVLIFQITSFWLVFELVLNLWWNKYHPRDPRPLFYYDQKEGDSGPTDRFFRWTGPVGHRVAKALAFILMIISIFLIYDSQAIR